MSREANPNMIPEQAPVNPARVSRFAQLVYVAGLLVVAMAYSANVFQVFSLILATESLTEVWFTVAGFSVIIMYLAHLVGVLLAAKSRLAWLSLALWAALGTTGFLTCLAVAEPVPSGSEVGSAPAYVFLAIHVGTGLFGAAGGYLLSGKASRGGLGAGTASLARRIWNVVKVPAISALATFLVAAAGWDDQPSAWQLALAIVGAILGALIARRTL